MRYTLAVIAIACLALAPVAPSQDTAQKGLALNGLDPVSLSGGAEVAGKEDLTAEHGHFRYQFSTDANRETFLGDPDRWGIQWGGGCGRMGPLSGRGDPSRWTVHDEHIYIFASEGCRDGFLSAPESFVVEATPPASPSFDAQRAAAPWLQKAVDNLGGADLDAHKALRLNFQRPQSEWMHRRDLLVTADGHISSRSKWTPPDPSDATTDTTWVVAETAFQIEDGNPPVPLSPAQQIDVLRIAHREPVVLLWARKLPGYRAARIEDSKFNGYTAINIEVSFAGLTTILHLDPGTGHVQGLSWRGRLNDGMTRDVTERFTGWTNAAGVLFPVRREVKVDGEVDGALGAASAWDGFEVMKEVPVEELRRR